MESITETQRKQEKQNKQKLLLCASITVLFWAAAFPMTKLVQAHFSSEALAFMRCSIAGCLLLFVGFFLKVKPPRYKDIPWFFLSGACGFGLYMIVFNRGLLTISSATSSIVIAITPILTAITASICYKEKIKPLAWLSIATAFLGVLILLLWDGILSMEVGVLWTLMASILFCFYNVLSRFLLQKGYISFQIATYSIVAGAILLLPYAQNGFSEFATATLEMRFAVFFLAIVPSAGAFLLWGKAMSYAKTTNEVTNFMFVTPLLSTLLGFLLLKEVPNWGTVIGGAIIILSLVGFNRVAAQANAEQLSE